MGDYQQRVINDGNKASLDLGSLVRDTKKFSGACIEEFSYPGGSVHLLFPPSAMNIAVIPVSGRHDTTEPYESAMSFVRHSAQLARRLGMHPIGITNILDLSDIDNQKIIPAAKQGLYDGAEKERVWIANGETAGLGERVTVPFNISGAVVAYVSRNDIRTGLHNYDGTQFSVSWHSNFGVYTNCDGNGTKPEWNERLYSMGMPFARELVQDGTAMLWDDAVKINADVIHDARVLELREPNTRAAEEVHAELRQLLKKNGAFSALKVLIAGENISGYGECPMNLSGTTVSLVNPRELRHMPIPKDGDTVMGFYNRDCRNLRANGITDQRKALVQAYGDDWHVKRTSLLKQVAAPSTVFYEFFKDLFSRNLATHVGHFSGGAYEGKFAKVLGKFGLGAGLEMEGGSFEAQEMLMRLQGQSLEQICRKQPYRLEAWATTRDPEKVMFAARDFGYTAIELGTARKMESPALRMTFTDRGETVSFPGA